MKIIRLYVHVSAGDDTFLIFYQIYEVLRQQYVYDIVELAYFKLIIFLIHEICFGDSYHVFILSQILARIASKYPKD